MPFICYEPKTFNDEHEGIIANANEIIEEYSAQGFSLTLRQLYYQFVSRDLIANTQQSYKRLGGIISAGRRAGCIDWDAIEDRTRNVRKKPAWDDEADLIQSCAWQFNIDMWADQGRRPEVWIEKDALLGVIEGVCNQLEVPFFSCRGYTSDSEVWGAGRRFRRQCLRHKQDPVVIHLGDHDPSGMDMTRDIENRLNLFAGPEVDVQVIRIALNMDQIEDQGPPPNPAKMTDARAKRYVAKYGHESWELDALEPSYMAQIIEETVVGLRDEGQWSEAVARRQRGRDAIQAVADRWGDVEDFVGESDE